MSAETLLTVREDAAQYAWRCSSNNANILDVVRLAVLFEEFGEEVRAEEREACAKLAEIGSAELRLAWGGVTTRELRIAQDVSILVVARIRRRSRTCPRNAGRT